MNIKFKQTQTMDMNKGEVKTISLSFAFPLVVGNLFQEFYNMVDTMVVGRFIGTQALAAVGTTAPVMRLLISLMIGLASEMSVAIAQTFGLGNSTVQENQSLTVCTLLLPLP